MPTPWRGKFSEYKTFDGVRVPTRAEVAWLLRDGPFTYFRGQVTGLVTLHDLVRVLLDVMDPAVWVMLCQTVFTPELRD